MDQSKVNYSIEILKCKIIKQLKIVDIYMDNLMWKMWIVWITRIHSYFICKRYSHCQNIKNSHI